MIALVEQDDGSFVQEERGEPNCGWDFCDKCGECLYCLASDPGPNPCPEGASREHLWVIYRNRQMEQP